MLFTLNKMNAKIPSAKTLLSALVLLAVLSPVAVTAGPGVEGKAVIGLAARQIDSALASVSASTRAVAAEFRMAHSAVAHASGSERVLVPEPIAKKGQVMMFRSWPGESDSAPEYQSPTPAYLAYAIETPDEGTYSQLEVFRQLTPAVRAAFNSFPYSWSYVTTVDNMMLLYPFLTLDEAVNNGIPTQQDFYTAADFENKRTGWTRPYLDLVGAGMMVTASTPAFDGESMLGVVSHDITLAQLSHSVLEQLVADAGGTAWLVDDSGLVVAVSDPGLQDELSAVNRDAGAAALHYREPGNGEATGMVVSGTQWINHVTEQVLRLEWPGQGSDSMNWSGQGHRVLARRLKETGWILLWDSVN